MGEYPGNFGLSGRVGDVELEEIELEKRTPLLNWKSMGRKIFLTFDVVVFIIFWFMALTDYSWYDSRVSLAFSILVMCLSVISFLVLFFWGTWQRLLIFLVCMLSFLGSLYGIPLHDYHSKQIPIQIEMAPNGTRFIEVYCSFTDAHATGFDHIEIIVRDNRFPFLQRDLGLYNNYFPQHCMSDIDSFVNWEDNNTIYVVERQAYLTVGYIKWDGILTSPGEIRSD